MIDSLNPDVMRKNIRNSKSDVKTIRTEVDANTEAVSELETLIGATPLETGKTITSELADHESRIDALEGGGGGTAPVVLYSSEDGTAGNITLSADFKTYDYLIFVWGVKQYGNIITTPVYYKLNNASNKIYCGLLGSTEKRYSASEDGLTLTEESGQSSLSVYAIYGCNY